MIEIVVETPTKLTARQKELLRELQETETGEEMPAIEGVLRPDQGSLGGVDGVAQCAGFKDASVVRMW